MCFATRVVDSIGKNPSNTHCIGMFGLFCAMNLTKCVFCSSCLGHSAARKFLQTSQQEDLEDKLVKDLVLLLVLVC